jgi:hypothetical protein
MQVPRCVGDIMHYNRYPYFRRPTKKREVKYEGKKHKTAAQLDALHRLFKDH